MEAVSFSFNDFDFVIEAFQAAGVNRVLAAVEDSVTMRPEVNDIASQSPRNPEIGVEKPELFKRNPLAVGGEEFQIMTENPDSSRSKVQVPEPTLFLVVDSYHLPSAPLAARLEPPVWNCFELKPSDHRQIPAAR